MGTTLPLKKIFLSLGSTVLAGFAIFNIVTNVKAAHAAAPCIITVFGQQYDVAPLQTNHTGGNIFVCGTDMTTVYQGMHGTDVSRIAAYLVTAPTPTPTVAPTTTPSITPTPTVIPTVTPTITPTVTPSTTPSPTITPTPTTSGHDDNDDHGLEDSDRNQHENHGQGDQHRSNDNNRGGSPIADTHRQSEHNQD